MGKGIWNYRLKKWGKQFILLFPIAAIIVIAFYIHSHFYALGLWWLIVIGGIIIILVLESIRLIQAGKLLKSKREGFIIFRDDERNQIMYGIKRCLILRNEQDHIREGKLYEAKTHVAGKNYFALLLVTNIDIKKVENISQEDLFKAGIDGREQFREHWKEFYGRYEPDEIARVIHFEVVEMAGE